MMAFDRMPSPRLEAQTLDALRAVMQRAMRKGDHGTELQQVLAQLCSQAGNAVRARETGQETVSDSSSPLTGEALFSI